MVTAWMVMIPALVLLLSGLSVDLWLATASRARLAAMADDAAVAGATAITADALRAGRAALDPALATARARDLLDSHPERDAIDGAAVDVLGDVVQVTLDGRTELTLLRMLGPTSIPIRVTGAARPAAVGS